ncbi:MAG: hypothetical protein NTY74_10250 [Ignavibacteriae bacterium]|nr:hypothetical protein [Ignavibacteriota bacterium]
MDNNEYKKVLNSESFSVLEKLFDVKLIKNEISYSFTITNPKLKNSIALDIFLDADGDNLVSVYSENSHLQLQSCRYFIISQMLEEIIFYTENGDMVSGLIISKQGDCSLYSNVDKKTLSSDFLNLNSEKLLSAVALSVIESI